MTGRISKLFSVGRHAAGIDWHIPMHQHAVHEMITITSGKEKVRTKESEFTAMTGDVLLFPAGTAHEEWVLEKTPRESYFLTFAWEDDITSWPVKTFDANGRLRMLAAWMYADRNTSLSETLTVQDTFFKACIRELIRVSLHPENNLVTAVRDYVHQHISNPISLDTLTRHAGMSKFHFIRQYRRFTGHTPMEEVRRIRLEHARDLLLTTAFPVKAIAPMAGLGDEISLYRLFQKYFHITPWRLRKTTRQ